MTFTTPDWRPKISNVYQSNVEPVNEVGGAALHAEINPEGSDTHYRFEWGKSPSEGGSGISEHNTPAPDGDIGSGTGNVQVSPRIEPLNGSTTYEYRVYAYNAEGSHTSAVHSFTTPDWSPEVTTEANEEVIPHIYKLHGKVDPKGFSTDYGFEYGEDESYGDKVEAEDPLTGTGEQEVALDIENLKGERIYHYRAFGTNEGNGSAQTNHGVDKSFETPDYRPAVTTDAATGIGTFETESGERYSTATFHGTVNPKARDATYRFEYGTSPWALSSSVPVPDGEIEAGLEDVEVSATLENLVPRAIYYYRLRADNEEGHHNGAIKTFTTPEWAIADTEDPAGSKASALTGSSCTSPTVCVAVGHYTNSEGTKVTLAQHRNGGQWQIEPTPNPEGAKEARLLSVSCAAANSCIATGHYKDASDQVKALAERWDGESWSILSTPNPEGAEETKLESVSCVAAGDCTAVGYAATGGEFSGTSQTLIEHFNGTSWSIVSSSNPEGHPRHLLYSVSCPSAEECWAVGQSKYTLLEEFTEEGKEPTALALHFDGESWSVASLGAEPPTNLSGVSCTSAVFCAAVANEGLKVLRYDGESWATETAPQPPAGSQGTFKALSCTSATACTAVGHYNDSEAEDVAPLAEHFDGTEWVAQQTTDPNGVLEGAWLLGSFQSVSCATASACAATGYFWDESIQENLIVETHPPGEEPTATTEAATNTEAPKVTLNATVNPGGEDTTFQFEYAAQGDYDPQSEDPYGAGGVVPSEPQGIGSATKGIAVAEQLGSLEPGTTYHFRVVAENNQGSDAGEDETFTTPE